MTTLGARDIWSILTEEDVDAKKRGDNVGSNASNENNQTTTIMKSSTARETYLLFVGDKQSGKTTAINMFLNPTKDEKPKPTVALEYTYGRKSSTNSSAKDIAHIWELGGGGQLSELIKVPLSIERIAKFHAILCINLEKPNKALSSLKSWMELIRNRVSVCMDELRRTRKGSKIEASMMKKETQLTTNSPLIKNRESITEVVTTVSKK